MDRALWSRSWCTVRAASAPTRSPFPQSSMIRGIPRPTRTAIVKLPNVNMLVEIGGYAGSPSFLRGQSADREADARSRHHDHRSLEGASMISAISSAISGLDPDLALGPASPGPAPSAAMPKAPCAARNPNSDMAMSARFATRSRPPSWATLKTGEAAAISGIQGQASVQHVVEAVMRRPDDPCRRRSRSATRLISAYQAHQPHVRPSEESIVTALTIAATGMNAQQQNLEVIANNIANINTTAFKRARAEFSDLLYQTGPPCRASPIAARTTPSPRAPSSASACTGGHPQPPHPGRLDQYGQPARPRAPRARLVPGDRRRRHDRSYDEAGSFNTERHGPARSPPTASR